jgi:hypothetical protein
MKLSVCPTEGTPTRNANIMKTTTHAISTHPSGFGLLILAACLLFAPGTRAGLTLTLDIYRNNHGTFFNFYTPLSTNTTLPDAPVGMYFISSPQWPTNGSTRQYEITTNGLNPNPISGQETGYSDYASTMQQITNGTWTILFINATTTNLYTFTMSAPTMTSNMLPATIITFPSTGALNIPNQPTFTWQGPTNLPFNDPYVANYDFSYYQPASIPAAHTNWTIPTPIPDGMNCTFSVNYITNYTTTLFVATTPLNTNASHQAISGWISTATIESGDAVSFAVTNPSSVGISLIAHYTFDNSGNLGQDSSGNGYDLNFNGGDGVTSSSEAKVGSGAAYFDGGSFFSYTSTPGNVLSTLAGDFSLSFWINTTETNGSEGGAAWGGDGIVAADVPGSHFDIVPAALDGGQIGFNTGPYDDTLNSTVNINDGNYHHVVITRSQATGEKQIYIDGVLNDTDSATMNPLSDPHLIAVGCAIDASQSNPASASTDQYFQGLLDDLQIYSGVLSSTQVEQLYASAVGQYFNAALNTTNLTWATNGDTSWFVETTNTYDGVSAAQSGSVTDYQSTSLTTTVTGPGNLTFYWSSIAEDSNEGFDYEFYIDDPGSGDQADLFGDNSWQQYGPIHIPPGQHTLGWTVYANGDSDPTQAGFLDQVIFTPPDTNPVAADITLDIYRGQDPTFGDIYIAWPLFNSVTPAGTGNTTNIVQSPNGMFSAQASAVGGGSSSWILSSLNQLINEFTNGLWTLYINKGLPTERQFHFSVSVGGLTTNLLSVVKIITPTNGAIGVPPNASFQWTGPTNYSSVSVSKQKADGSGYVSATLSLTAANWPSPPVLAAGTNQFDVNYTSNGFPNMTFTIPVDTNDSQIVSSWVTHVDLHSTATSVFIVTAGPLPTALLSPQDNGVNFQFQFLSQAGFNHSILYRTNLAVGNWQTNSTIAGDGTLKTISIPLSVFSPSKQGFIRVSTQ